jgi:hypothetical protein
MAIPAKAQLQLLKALLGHDCFNSLLQTFCHHKPPRTLDDPEVISTCARGGAHPLVAQQRPVSGEQSLSKKGLIPIGVV